MTDLTVQRLVKYSLILGVVATMVAFVFPLLLTGHVRRERARIAACERQERIDCEPSIIWLLLK